MANQWETIIGSAVKRLAEAVADATQLEITTHFVEPDANGVVVTKTTRDDGSRQTTVGTAVVSAYTRIDLVDGDYLDVVPVKKTDGGYTVATEIHDIHKSNVADAREYVADLVSTLMQAVQSVIG
jgi:hypothetical protein